MIDNRETGEILKKYMQNMTQTELSKRIGVKPQYINNVFNNIKSPSENFLEQFFQIFDVSIEDRQKIEDNENFKKIPDKYKNELLKNRQKIEELNNGSTLSKIEYIGILDNYGNIIKENINEMYFPKLSYENNMLFCIKMGNMASNNFAINDIVVLKKLNDIEEKNKLENEYNSENIIYYIKYKNNIMICSIEYSCEAYIIKNILNDKKSILINNNEKEIFEIKGKVKYVLKSI